MAAKTFWDREDAESLIDSLYPAFERDDIESVVVCGCIRRNPAIAKVKHLSLIGVSRANANNTEIDQDLRRKVITMFPRHNIKAYAGYNFIEFEDGNVSWVVANAYAAGATLMHATGPIPFIKLIDEAAGARGMRFGVSGVADLSTSRVMVTPTESEVFNLLKVQGVSLDRRDSVTTLTPLADADPPVAGPPPVIDTTHGGTLIRSDGSVAMGAAGPPPQVGPPGAASSQVASASFQGNSAPATIGDDEYFLSPAYLIRETDKAYGVGLKPGSGIDEWIPKSQTRQQSLVVGSSGWMIITMWLAEKRGFVT